MWRIPIACGVVAGALLCAQAPLVAADDRALTLTASGAETGWISFAVRGPERGTVVIREQVAGGRGKTVRLALRDGAAERARVARWRCSVRTRRFTATLRAGGGRETAKASIVTPSCARRLRMIVVPAHLRPGEQASVRITDTWRFGGIAANVCARPDGDATRCRRLRLAKDARTRRMRVRLAAPGHRTIALSSQFGQRIEGRVEVRDDAQARVLVTGDSMIMGLFQALAHDLGPAAAVVGDAHPGRGITTPGGYLDWPAHARLSARTLRPDVTVVFLGSADAGYPLAAASGETVACCESAWVGAYADRVRAMIDAYLRDDRGLVYWVLLPVPRSPAKALVARAENDAVRLAGRGYDDGVRVVERVAGILAPGDRFVETIRVDGHDVVVRDPDGVHLTPQGIAIASNVVHETLRTDGLLP